MSYNLCAISGKVINHPVICSKTGYVYERDLIHNYIDMTGECPITHVTLTKEDLMEIKNSNYTKPRDTNDSSIDGLFTNLKQEFGTTVSDVAALKKTIDDTKKELANASYKYEASINVINKLIQEKEIVLMQVEKYRNTMIE